MSPCIGLTGSSRFRDARRAGRRYAAPRMKTLIAALLLVALPSSAPAADSLAVAEVPGVLQIPGAFT